MNLPDTFKTVTQFSKTLSIILFVSLPFIGFYLGKQYQQFLTFNSTNIVNNKYRPVVLSPTPSVFPTIPPKNEGNYKLCPDASYVKISSSNQVPDCRWGVDGLGIKEGGGFEFPKYQNDPAEKVKGGVEIFTVDTNNTEIQLSAKSSAGKVTEIEVWSDIKPNTIWQPFNEYVSIPNNIINQFIYVKFKDDKGNISYTYYTSVYPHGIPNPGL